MFSCTVPLKGKSTVSTPNLILDPWSLRESRIEFQVRFLGIEFRGVLCIWQHVFAFSFHWFMGLSVSYVIGLRSDYFGFGFSTLNWKMLNCKALIIIKSTKQRSKLRPFWSPWQVEKIFGDQNSGKSRVMATILQLKVTKRRLFEKVSLERCTQKEFEVFEIKLSIKVIICTKNLNFLSKKTCLKPLWVFVCENSIVLDFLVVDVQRLWLAFIVRKTYIWWQWTLVLFRFWSKKL